MARMSIAPPLHRSMERARSAIAERAAHVLRHPAVTADADAVLFSVKSFAAAMLACYLALRIGLPKPFWAIVTVYIVSQSSVGASLSRGVYRFVGTIAGAVATVAIVPNFVNDPIACSAVLACWIGLCLFLSLLDRTPRAYAFVLAGYTASLIGFPSVLDTGAVFDTALVRVQEISIGIRISREYKLPPKNTIGVMTNDGIIDICSKFLLTTPIKNPNKAKVKETNTNKNIINFGCITLTSAKKEAVA